MRKIIVKPANERPAAAFGPAYLAHFEGQEDSSRYGYGETPQKAKRELLLSQEILETAGGASISVWTRSGTIKFWAHSNAGTPTSVTLHPWEVDALIERLQLGREVA